MVLTEIKRRRAHIRNLLLIESINPRRFSLIVNSKIISEQMNERKKKRNLVGRNLVTEFNSS